MFGGRLDIYDSPREVNLQEGCYEFSGYSLAMLYLAHVRSIYYLPPVPCWIIKALQRPYRIIASIADPYCTCVLPHG